MTDGAETVPETGFRLARSRWVAVAVLLTVVVAIFPRVVLGSRVFFYRDIHLYWYPAIEVFVRSVSEGSLPLWSPHFGLGEPLLANPGFQIAYPPTWLNLLLPPSSYYALFVFSHLVGGGLGMTRLGERVGLSLPASLLAGVSWCASGPVLSAVSLWHHFAGAAWIPWMLWAWDRTMEEPRPRRWVGLGAMAAGQSLAGSADMCVMTAVGGVVWYISRRRAGGLLGVVSGLAVAGGFAFCLAAIQWLPALDILRGSVRSFYEHDANTYWSAHPGRIVEMLTPVKLGVLPISAISRTWLFEGREPFLASLYLGAASAALAGIGVLARSGAVSGRLRAGLGAGFALCLLAAIGRYSPLYSLLLALPPIAVLRYPVKFVLLAAVFWGLLVGVGLETVLRAPGRGRARLGLPVLGCGLALLLAGEVLWPRVPSEWWAPGERPGAVAALTAASRVAASLYLGVGALLLWRARGRDRMLALALLALASGDLVVAGRTVNPLAPPELMTHRPPILDALPDADQVRVYVDLPPRGVLLGSLTRGPVGWEPEPRWALGAIETLRPPTGARFGLDGSYDGDPTGLLPGRLLPLEMRVRASGEDALRLLQRSAVTHVITLAKDLPPGTRDAGEWLSVFSAPIRLGRLEGALPRAFVVDGIRIVQWPAVYDVLTAAGFDPRREVILRDGIPRAPSPGFRGRAEIVERGSDRVVVDASLSRAGHLVVLDGFDEGWEAWVDGSPAEVLRADVVFRAVALPPGSHRVELRYRPRSVAIGSGLTAGAALIAIGFAWTARMRRS